MSALNAPRLTSLLQDISTSIARGVHSLIDRKVEYQRGQLRRTGLDALASVLPTPAVIVRGTAAVRFVVDSPTAIALAGHMRMDAPRHTGGRDHGTPSREDLESFSDIATAICSGANAALRRASVKHPDLRLEGYRAFDPDRGWGEHLGNDLLWYRFPIRIDGGPESALHVILDLETGALWNGGTLDVPDEIPEAPIRGRLAAYMVDPDLPEVIRKTCRRVGLELDHFPAGAIPNPAAHKGDLVLMDIPTGEERRFAWCKRLREHGGVRTILIVHHPSRARIIAAFRAEADVILGWPVTEAELSPKVAAILDETPSPGGVGS